MTDIEDARADLQEALDWIAPYQEAVNSVSLALRRDQVVALLEATAPPTDDVYPVVAAQTWMAADVHAALGRGNITEPNDGDRSWSDWWARLLHDVRALTAPPTDDEREALARIMEPTAWQPPILPETYREVERQESLRRADLAHAAGFRRQGPITDDEREALVKQLADEVEYRIRTAVALSKGGHGIGAQVTEGRAAVERIAAGFCRQGAHDG